MPVESWMIAQISQLWNVIGKELWSDLILNKDLIHNNYDCTITLKLFEAITRSIHLVPRRIVFDKET